MGEIDNSLAIEICSDMLKMILFGIIDEDYVVNQVY
jgi:hypothetical protein